MQRLCRPWYPDQKDTTRQQQIINDCKGYRPHWTDRLLFAFFLGGPLANWEEWHSWGTLQFLWECMVPCLYKVYRWMGKIREGNSNQTLQENSWTSQQAVPAGLYVNPQQSTQMGGWGYMGSPKPCAKCCMLFGWLLFGDLKSCLGQMFQSSCLKQTKCHGKKRIKLHE